LSPQLSWSARFALPPLTISALDAKKAPETSPGLSSFDRPRNYVVVRILKIEAVSFDRGAPSDATTKVTQNHV